MMLEIQLVHFLFCFFFKKSILLHMLQISIYGLVGTLIILIDRDEDDKVDVWLYAIRRD